MESVEGEVARRGVTAQWGSRREKGWGRARARWALARWCGVGAVSVRSRSPARELPHSVP